MTDLLALLSDLEKAATPGPWKHDLGNCEIEGPRPARHPICDISRDARACNTADANPIDPYADADFITALRNAAPKLIAVARAAKVVQENILGVCADPCGCMECNLRDALTALQEGK